MYFFHENKTVFFILNIIFYSVAFVFKLDIGIISSKHLKELTSNRKSTGNIDCLSLF